ncbi:hypothetical protein LZ686_00520 [Paracoccus sp. NFXS7]|uniref:hypothetical protein n=1 Tax=Paracoccus sp. NFXS7 TaxID=2908653 RepID=UPI0032E025D6
MAEEPDLLISAGFSDAQLVRETNKVVAQFRKRGEEAQKAFQDATGRITDTSAARAHARELDRLSKAYDPVYRAASTYEAEVKRLDRALDVGAITQTQYTAKVSDAAAQFQRAFASIVAGADQMARGMQRAHMGTTALTRTTGPVVANFRRFGPQIQQAGYQFGDFAVQVGAGTSAMQAAGQQAPQLLGAFGPMGAVLGLVAAVAFPLANAFLGMGKEADSLEDKVKALEGAISDYTSAAEAANTPTDELIQKYGTAAVAAQGLLAQLAQIAKIEAGAALAANGAAIAATFEDLSSYIALADGEISQFGDSSSGLLTIADALKDQFGLSIDQARELQGILADQAAAKTVQDQAAAMQSLAAFLNEAAESAQYANGELNAAAKAASEGSLAGLELATALEAADVAAGGVVATVDQLPGSIDSATASALAMAAALRTAIGVAQSMPGAIGPDLNRFGDGADITRRAGGLDLQEQQDFRYENLQRLAEEAAERARAASRSRTGRGSGSKKSAKAATKNNDEEPLFADVEKDIVGLERQISLIGKSNQEIATARARWEALDEAKRRGIPVNDEMSAQIERQAAKFGMLTAELEKAEAAQAQFDQAIDGIANAMAGALLAGESLREGLAQVLKGIAADILNSGIRSAIAGQFSGGGGGFNPFALIGNVFSGGDALSNGLRGAGLNPVGSWDGGGFTWSGPRSGGIDGKGGQLGILHPNETVLDHTRGQGAGGQSVLMVDLSPDLQARILEQAMGQSIQITQQAQVAQAKALPGKVQRINAKPRQR